MIGAVCDLQNRPMVETYGIPTRGFLPCNSLTIEFRQAVYDHALTYARDAQFELVDALLRSAPIRTFPALSLRPAFRRQWPSVYAAVEDGRQDREWLEGYLLAPLSGTGRL